MVNSTICKGKSSNIAKKRADQDNGVHYRRLSVRFVTVESRRSYDADMISCERPIASLRESLIRPWESCDRCWSPALARFRPRARTSSSGPSRATVVFKIAERFQRCAGRRHWTSPGGAICRLEYEFGGRGYVEDEFAAGPARPTAAVLRAGRP